MGRRGPASQARRDAVLARGLSLQLDSDGKIMIKCHRMFASELRKILREIEEKAVIRVRTRHGASRGPFDQRTGNLAASIRRTPVKKIGTERITGSVIAGGRKAPYAEYVHDGTDPGIRRVKNPNRWFSFMHTGRTATFRTRTSYNENDIINQQLSGAEVREADYRYTKGPRKGQFKSYSERVTVDLADRQIAVKEINHPGYKGDKFITNSAVGVVRKYGGKVKRRDGSIIR